MANVLVTGGAGFLGSYVCERLLDLQHHVVAFDMSSGEKISHLMEHPRFRFVQDSILNLPTLKHEIERADIVVHFAAIADPKRYVTEPLVTLQIDLQGALYVFQYAAETGAKVIFASTSEVYGRNPNVPWREDADRVVGSSAINRWCYATAKAAGEHYLYAYRQQEKLRFVAFRFFNVYGPRLDDLGSGRVLPIFLNQCLQGEPMTIHGDGAQTRSFVYVEDTADCVVRGIFNEQAEGQIFNVGCSQELSITELANALKAVGGFTSPIIYVPHREVFGPSYEDIPRRVPDVSKAKRLLGWEATTSLEEGLRRTIAYYQEYLRTAHLSQSITEPPESRPWPGSLTTPSPSSQGGINTLIQNITIRPLEWDSRHFSVKMGAVEIPEPLTQESPEAVRKILDATIEDVRREGYQQLTVRVAPQDITLIHGLEDLGFRFVDALVTLETPMEPRGFPTTVVPPGIAVRQALPYDVSGLMDIARRAFADRSVWLDRFHADPKIPKHLADELYAKWVKNSVTPDVAAERMADMTLVAVADGVVAGFLTCRLVGEGSNRYGVVALNAVDAAFRRRGIYHVLSQTSLKWFVQQGCRAVRIRTSLSSHGVRRTWSTLGATPITNEYTFHWWA